MSHPLPTPPPPLRTFLPNNPPSKRAIRRCEERRARNQPDTIQSRKIILDRLQTDTLASSPTPRSHAEGVAFDALCIILRYLDRKSAIRLGWVSRSFFLSLRSFASKALFMDETHCGFQGFSFQLSRLLSILASPMAHCIRSIRVKVELEQDLELLREIHQFGRLEHLRICSTSMKEIQVARTLPIEEIVLPALQFPSTLKRLELYWALPKQSQPMKVQPHLSHMQHLLQCLRSSSLEQLETVVLRWHFSHVSLFYIADPSDIILDLSPLVDLPSLTELDMVIPDHQHPDTLMDTVSQLSHLKFLHISHRLWKGGHGPVAWSDFMLRRLLTAPKSPQHLELLDLSQTKFGEANPAPLLEKELRHLKTLAFENSISMSATGSDGILLADCIFLRSMVQLSELHLTFEVGHICSSALGESLASCSSTLTDLSLQTTFISTNFMDTVLSALTGLTQLNLEALSVPSLESFTVATHLHSTLRTLTLACQEPLVNTNVYHILSLHSLDTLWLKVHFSPPLDESITEERFFRLPTDGAHVRLYDERDHEIRKKYVPNLQYIVPYRRLPPIKQPL